MAGSTHLETEDRHELIGLGWPGKIVPVKNVELTSFWVGNAAYLSMPLLGLILFKESAAPCPTVAEAFGSSAKCGPR